jgi:hypothetical protein
VGGRIELVGWGANLLANGRINVVGDVSGGGIKVEGYTASGSVIDVDGDLVAGGDLVIRRYAEGGIHVGGDVSLWGEIDVWEYLGGDIDIDGSVSGTIDVGGSVDLGADIDIDGTVSGTIDVGGSVDSGADIRIDGDVSGDIAVGGDLDGDIYLGTLGATPDLLGSIDVGGALGPNGRIIVWGACDGDIIIADDTGKNSHITCFGGLEDDGSIVVNDDRGDYDHNGTIYVGQAVLTHPLCPVTFDGYIMITDDTSGNGGDNEGTIEVVGCHDEEDVLDVCICGGDGSVTVTQDGCEYTATVECLTGCP